MTPRERFLLAFSHEEGDRVPVFDAPNNPALFVRELGKENLYSEGVPMVYLSRALGMDACLVPEAGYTGLVSKHWHWQSPDRFTDELGVEYVYNDSSWPLAVPVKESIRTREDWERIRLPDPCEAWRTEQIRAAVKEAHRGRKDDIAVIAGIRSAFSVMYISMGLANLSLCLYDDPALIRDMSERLCGFWTTSALRACECGVDAVFIANDMGLSTGTILSPNDLRRFFFPHLAKQISEIKKTGVKVILHSCGNVNDILDDIVLSGADCLNNIQKSAGMDIGAVKRSYGDRIALMGNVDATNIMTAPDPQTIRAEVARTIGIASQGGGHILATDHSFHKGIPIENVYAFLEAAREYGCYPLNSSSVS